MKSKVNKTVEVKNEVVVVELTQKENKVLMNLIDGLYAEAGFSDIDCNDLAKSSKMKVEEVKGVIGSLVKKELVFTEKTSTSGAKQYEIVYLAPFAWSLHPIWKDETEHELNISIIDSKKTQSNKKEVVKENKAVKKTNNVKTLSESKDDEVFDDISKNKPYSVYGLHGKNVDLDGFVKGDKVTFKIGDEDVVGEYVHFHVNNWSKNGYAVIKYNGKIYERVSSKISKFVEPKKVVKKSVKKVTK